MKPKIMKNAAYWSGVVILGLVVGVSIQFVTAWTEPTEAPPGGNLSAPVNTGETGQIKQGNLILNSLGTYLTGLLVNGQFQITNGKGYTDLDNLTQKTDPENTLATKSYVDAQSGGGGGMTKITSSENSSITDGQVQELREFADTDNCRVVYYRCVYTDTASNTHYLYMNTNQFRIMYNSSNVWRDIHFDSGNCWRWADGGPKCLVNIGTSIYCSGGWAFYGSCN